MGKALADTFAIPTEDMACRFAKAAHRDTPPVDVIYRGRSPGLRVVVSVRSSQGIRVPVTSDEQKLAAYSCGGSFGMNAMKASNRIPS